MPTINAVQLRKAIKREEFDYTLLSSVLAKYAGPRQKIHTFLKSGVIVRVKKGLYVFGPEYNFSPVCKEALANLIYGPSYISLEYALAFHGMIPERVEVVTSVTFKKDKKFDTPLGRFTYRYLGLSKYAIGFELLSIDRLHPVLMATQEKALCDYIVLNKISGFKTTTEIQKFLESDLRIKKEHWVRLKVHELREINQIFSNQTISKIIELLELRGVPK